MKVWLALKLWTAAVRTFAQTNSDTSGTGTSHGFAVSDGDTVKFGKQLIRLFGIDAPEKGQPCDDGKWFPGRWRPRLLSPSLPAGRSRAAKWTMTARTTIPSRFALLARTTSRR